MTSRLRLRKQYEQHVANMFKLAGESPDKAAADAKTVMQVETALAKASMDRIERRDPNKVYHKMTTAQLQELSPAFNWNEYFVAVKSPEFSSLDVSVPDFVKGMNQVIATSDLDDHQDLSALADPARGGAAVAESFRRREFQLLRQDADRREGAASPLEALRAASPTAIWAKRWARLTLPRPSRRSARPPR